MATIGLDKLYYSKITEDADGNETDQANGYYVVLFGGKDDNTAPMGNVRHLLVKFEGGTTDKDTGKVTYSAEEIAKVEMMPKLDGKKMNMILAPKSKK